MGSNISFGVKFDNLSMETAIAKLSEAVGEEVLRSAGFAGAVVIRDEVIARAPEKSGELKQNIAIIRDKSKSESNKRQTYLIRVARITRSYANTRVNRRKGIVGKKYQIDGPAFYWRFLEYGTSKMSAQPFIRPSFDAKVNDALEAVRQRLRFKIAEKLKGTPE